MTEQITKLIEVIAILVQALSWPLIVLFILIYFGAPLKKFLSDIGEFTFKAGTSGLEATAKRQQIEVAALLGAASAKPTELPAEQKAPDLEKAREIADVVGRAVKPRVVRRLAEASVLWVDDIPANNLYERRALETLGIHFAISTSTEDALERLRLNKYDVIISDMGRPPDIRAGYTLLEAVRKSGDTTPFIIYSSSNLPEHKAEARRKGAFGSTNNPQELFELVLSAIQSE
jgi:CheY-like chemotaxis protein